MPDENSVPEKEQRSPAEIQREIHEARADLVEHVAELEHIVKERLDPRWYLHRAAERGRALLASAKRELATTPPPVIFASACAVFLALGAILRGARKA